MKCHSWLSEAASSSSSNLKAFVWVGTLWILSIESYFCLGMGRSRKTALIQGDILIGALVSVHHQPKQKTASSLECGEIREQYGIQRVEAAFLAVDQINDNPDLLPNITLGIEIRDSCWYSSIALEQSIEFIRDAIASPEGGANKSRPDACAPPPSSKNLVGVVGPGSSAVTIQVQNLLQLFSIPQVGYSATSRDLSEKSSFSYFLRVVPSDYYQAQVMVDIVKHYNWTYVSTVQTYGNYGQSGMAAFRELAERDNICIAKEDTVPSNAEDAEFENVIRQLSQDNRANVVVCFCEGMTVRNLLKAVQKLNKVSRFLFLGSDGWADRSDVIAGLEEVAIGGLSIKIHSSYVEEFDDYYFSLQPGNNSRNPWFTEFWEHRFNCTFYEIPPINGPPSCTGNEKLSEGYKQDTKMSFVIKAIYTMAYGLHDLHRNLCKGQPGLCRQMLPINGSLFRDYLMNASFPYMNETVSFDYRGDPPGRYDIMNFQRLENGSYEYVPVGSWDNGTLRVNESLVMFNGSDKTPPISVCSKPCEPGQVKSFVEMGDAKKRLCCWFCNDCADDEYLQNETTCSPCDKDHRPNASKTGCEPITVEYLDWNDREAIAALTVALMGFSATLFTMLVFLKFNDTPVVKASTRELSYIIFVGMMVSYSSSLPLLAMPSQVTCAFSRILPGFSFSMIYAALVTKTNRIARILAGNKKIIIRKLRFMSATAQVVITCILISIEAVIILVMLIHEPPDAIKSYPAKGKVVLICNTTPLGIIAPLAWDFFLITLCTIYAVKTRNLPENFNEAKFIGFSMYTTCVIWLAWVPIYFGSDHNIISMSICTSLSAFVTLVLLFCPKLYIILLRPEKNDRSAFKTSTTVRCHIGSANKAQRAPSQEKSITDTQSLADSSTGLGPDSKWSGLMDRIRGAKQEGTIAPTSQATMLKPALREAHPRAFLKRETSFWGDVAGGLVRGNVSQHRESMLKRAFGSQLDLEKNSPLLGHETRSSQTTDDLLDPLIPRLRRRIARSVREGQLDASQGREFFNITHKWMQEQAEAYHASQKQKETNSVEKFPENKEESSKLKDSNPDAKVDQTNISVDKNFKDPDSEVVSGVRPKEYSNGFIPTSENKDSHKSKPEDQSKPSPSPEVQKESPNQRPPHEEDLIHLSKSSSNGKECWCLQDGDPKVIPSAKKPEDAPKNVSVMPFFSQTEAKAKSTSVSPSAECNPTLSGELSPDKKGADRQSRRSEKRKSLSKKRGHEASSSKGNGTSTGHCFSSSAEAEGALKTSPTKTKQPASRTPSENELIILNILRKRSISRRRESEKHKDKAESEDELMSQVPLDPEGTGKDIESNPLSVSERPFQGNQEDSCGSGPHPVGWLINQNLSNDSKENSSGQTSNSSFRTKNLPDDEAKWTCGESEAETDDSVSGIEQFFLERGLTFDCTSKQSKKL